ncbi:MAG TPA: methylthioribulose 1-phosphate dehydratase [Pyrinomonadaceae bacterium]|nr:methylthioribulose 1-phosphate dehydratase [Pyrinomonadaceae bacterium]
MEPRRSEIEAFKQLATQLVEVGRRFYSRGWCSGTSGNFSAVLTRDPLTLAMTASGVDKGELTSDQVLHIDGQGIVLNGARLKPSDESPLHLRVARDLPVGAVLHTHSVWSTILSDLHAAEGHVSIEGYEMLKGLSNVHTHEHCEWLPIIDNSQVMSTLADTISDRLRQDPPIHGFLLRGHGLYTWGADLHEAVRHVEILEFLLEAVGRANSLRRIFVEGA